MKRTLLRMLVVAIVGIGLWQGAIAVRGLFRKPVAHQALVHNAGRRAIATIELRVGRQRMAMGALAARDTARQEFRVADDALVGLRWTWEDTPAAEHVWQGARIARGPLPQRLVVTLHDDGGVMSRVVSLGPGGHPGHSEASR